MVFPWAGRALWGQRAFITLAPGLGLEAELGLADWDYSPEPQTQLVEGHLCLCWGHHGLGLLPLSLGGLLSPLLSHLQSLTRAQSHNAKVRGCVQNCRISPQHRLLIFPPPRQHCLVEGVTGIYLLPHFWLGPDSCPEYLDCQKCRQTSPLMMGRQTGLWLPVGLPHPQDYTTKLAFLPKQQLDRNALHLACL